MTSAADPPDPPDPPTTTESCCEPARQGGTVYGQRNPPPASAPVVTLREGGTPLVVAEHLSERLGMTVHLKVETPGLMESLAGFVVDARLLVAGSRRLLFRRLRTGSVVIAEPQSV